MKNSDHYIQQFGTLSSSGVGVVYTRTREPFRAMKALKDWAFSKDLPYYQWNTMQGWVKSLPTDDPDKKPEADKKIDCYTAMKFIRDVDGNGDNAIDKGVFVMHALHPWLSKHPGLIECLRQYVRIFAEMSRLRLILIVPETENLPDELSHDIPVLDFDLPNAEEIAELYEYILDSSTPEGQEVPKMYGDQLIETIVNSAGGMTQMECEVAFAKAVVVNRPSWPHIPFDDYNGIVLGAKTEIVKQSEVLELMDPVSMDDVGGLELYKDWITTASKCFGEEARAFGVDAPKGIVAIGPPGTGKSLLGKATGAALHMPIVKFDVSRVYGSLVGQSEQKTRSALKMLDAMAPCVAFIDELDKGLGGAHSGGGDSGVSKRVLGAILTHMQESKAPIFWIASANRVDSLPAELLRKGRFDEVFAILPPNKVEREQILRIHLGGKRKQNADAIDDLHIAVCRSRGYVGAEIEAAVKEAIKAAFVHGLPLTGQLIADQFDEMKPLSEAFPEDFAAMETWAENNARKASLRIDETHDDEPAVAPANNGQTRARRRALS